MSSTWVIASKELLDLRRDRLFAVLIVALLWLVWMMRDAHRMLQDAKKMTAIIQMLQEREQCTCPRTEDGTVTFYSEGCLVHRDRAASE